jgi:hypothetical protein
MDCGMEWLKTKSFFKKSLKNTFYILKLFGICPIGDLKTNFNAWKMDLKRQYHEIFDPWFFHQSTAPRPLINPLKYFSVSFRFGGGMGKKA